MGIGRVRSALILSIFYFAISALKAKLLADSNAFSQEIAWLRQSGNDLSGDVQRAALYSFLLGVGYRGVEDTANSKACFLRVVAMSAGSDLGKTATQLLRSP